MTLTEWIVAGVIVLLVVVVMEVVDARLRARDRRRFNAAIRQAVGDLSFVPTDELVEEIRRRSIGSLVCMVCEPRKDHEPPQMSMWIKGSREVVMVCKYETVRQVDELIRKEPG